VAYILKTPIQLTTLSTKPEFTINKKGAFRTDVYRVRLPDFDQIAYVLGQEVTITIQNTLFRFSNEPSLAKRTSEDLESINEHHTSILDVLAPERVVRTRGPEQLTNPRIEKAKKKRDRALKKYKKFGDEKYLKKSRQLTVRLKQMIKHETKETFQKKAQSPNPKCFWNSINNLQGKAGKADMKLKINGQLCEDNNLIAQHVATFFDNKIKGLTSGMPALTNPVTDELPIMDYFTLEEVTNAIKKVKGKMSSGVDGIPLKLVKLYGQCYPEVYQDLFNNVISNGYPKLWKKARIVPVPKKGDLTDVKNYRPVSNLCSLSKVFERCIHARITKMAVYDRLIGDHQHGFREFHSTTTCLMTLRDYIAESIDTGKHGILYSLDLSAAFDMLRIDLLYENLKDDIPSGIMRIIIDFLSERTFRVNVGTAMSDPISIDRGCPQGSVLGPILFNLYVGKCMSGLEGCNFVSYADDSYVLNYGNTIDEAKSAARKNMIKHISNLREAGMVVNQAKTEVIAFSKSKAVNTIEIDLDDGTRLQSAKKIKALGIWIDDKLKWDAHVKELRKRIVKITSGLKLIRRKLNLKQAINIVTAQALSILYYASPAWFTPNIGKRELSDIERIHFKALRVAVCDYRQRLSRDTICQNEQAAA